MGRARLERVTADLKDRCSFSELPARGASEDTRSGDAARAADVDDLLSARRDANGHELSGVRRRVLDDASELNAGERQTLRDGLERSFIRNAENNSDRLIGQVARRRVAGSVVELRCERAER